MEPTVRGNTLLEPRVLSWKVGREILTPTRRAALLGEGGPSGGVLGSTGIVETVWWYTPVILALGAGGEGKGIATCLRSSWATQQDSQKLKKYKLERWISG